MLLTEQVLSLQEAADCLPRPGGRRVHYSLVWRWCRRGISVTGPDGKPVRVYLEHRRLGRQIVTSREALERFSAALAAVELAPARPRPPIPPARSRTARQREADVAAAERRLAERGA